MEREYLQAGDTLALRRTGTSGEGVWTIESVLGEGGACVCYEARCGGRSGRLKEFYPLSDRQEPLCRRTGDGQLAFLDPGQGQARCGEFLAAYGLLERTRQEEPDARVLNNFIPPYELLRSKGQPGTCYVWTPDDKQGISFEDYLGEVWADPARGAEHKLYNILSAVLTLTDCVRVLHRAGLLLLDIKPSNFLVLYDGDFNINPASVSLFDVNTLCHVDDPFLSAAGTDGYCAPEIRAGRADNRADIYSIGAMLLRAVTGGLWESGAALEQRVASAALIQASEANSNVFLRHTLIRILKKCLAERPAQRYGCCEALMADLRQARAFLIPEVENSHLGLQKKLALLDREPPERCTSTAVLRDLLFRHPLEEPGQEEIRVLAVGAGTYGQNFIDCCLQAGQMLGRHLHIRAVSQDPALDREVYLQIRPALPEFVDCCGSLGGSGESYGRLDFEPAPIAFRPEDPAHNRRAVRAMLRSFGGELPGYVFVALGDDDLNRTVADLLRRELGISKVFHVIQSGADGPREPGAVYIGAPLSVQAIDPRLENMAFNAHLCWIDAPDGDLRLARSSFRRRYNLESSLAYALSVGSKLRSVGVYEPDPELAAARFQQEVLEGDPEVLDRMVALEHRRWVVEKITAGWQPPRKDDGALDLWSGILRGTMKDRQNRAHPCIVRSRTGSSLRDHTRQQWDVPNPGDETLDELDRVSLEQHRLCLARTRQLRDQHPLQQGDMARMGQLLAGGPAQVLRAFGRYRLCLQRILSGSRADAKEFDSCERNLRQTLSQLSPELRQEMTERMQRLRRDFFPAVESCLYRDYKRTDEALIRQIPFVLTHIPERSLAMFLARKDRVANVASAAVLRPEKITYLVRLTPEEGPGELPRILGGILDFFGGRCRVGVLCAGPVPRGLEPELTALKAHSPQFRFRLLPCGEDAVMERLKAALAETGADLFDCTTAEQETAFADWPRFRFDRDRREFTDCRGCERLRYLPTDVTIRLKDLNALTGGTFAGAEVPEWGWEVRQLSRLYRTNRDRWDPLCRNLAAAARKSGQLGAVTLPRKGRPAELVRLFPEYLYGPLEQLVQCLRSCGAAEPGSGLEADSADACCLRLITCCRVKDMEKLLEGLYDVENWRTLAVRSDGRRAEFIWDDLRIRALPLEGWERELLEQMQELGVIRGLRLRGGTAAFRFSTAGGKKLLTWPHRIRQYLAWEQVRAAECFEEGGCQDSPARCLLIQGFRIAQVQWDENGRPWGSLLSGETPEAELWLNKIMEQICEEEPVCTNPNPSTPQV